MVISGKELGKCMQEDLDLGLRFPRLTALLLLPLCLVLLCLLHPKPSLWVIQISGRNTDVFSFLA